VAFKYAIDPDRVSSRDTLCNNLRWLYRERRANGDTAAMDRLARAFDYAKRMDARLKYYRNKYEPHRQGPEIKEGHGPDLVD
jgi:hypothetical protein